MAAPTISFEGFGVIDDADAATNWVGGGSQDVDSEVQGTACRGAKVATATTAFVYDASGDAGQPLNFSASGNHFGQHIYVWLNCLTPSLDTITNGGLRIRAGSSTTDFGDWYVGGDGTVAGDPYRGGWKNFVINPARSFDAVGGTFSTGGNPSQLNACDTFGGVVKTIAGIMGNFNNGLCDQISVGYGLRAEDGDGTNPGKFQSFVAADAGDKNNKYGVAREVSGVTFMQGKAFIGDTGSASTVFINTSSVVIFESAPVSSIFYEIKIEDNAGSAQTNVLFGTASAGVTSAGMFIASAGGNEWLLQVDLQNASSKFECYASVLQNVNTASLNSRTTIQDCQILDSGQFDANLAVIASCSFGGGVDTVQLKIDDNPEMDVVTHCLFANCNRAIQINQTGSYTFNGITFNGNTFDLQNNSGGSASISIVGGGDTPTVENIGAGSHTDILNSITVTLTGLISGSEVRVYTTGSTTELDGIENSTSSFAFSIDANETIDIVIHKEDYEHQRIETFKPGSSTTVPISQRFDRNYNNP